jgi:uncharacterized repeat protein (TIGR01451 family)
MRRSAPAWFRYGVIALATLILCSCTAAKPAKGDGPLVCEDCPDGACGEGAACTTCSNNCAVPGPYDEYLCDGGDQGYEAVVEKNQRFAGLEQEDTVARYDTVDGRTFVAPSNKVCIYAPRFAVVRQVIDLRENRRYEMVVDAARLAGPVGMKDREAASVRLASAKPTIDRLRQPPSLLRDRRQPGELGREQRPGAAIGSLAPYATLQVVETGRIDGLDVVKLARASLAAVAWAGVEAPQIFIDNRQAVAVVGLDSPGAVYQLREPNNPRLRLIKLASTHNALPGEIVEFTLRFDNIGDREMKNVAIVDSLTTRLEYVADSQEASVEAAFSEDPNACDSLVLRWDLAAPLRPGDGGVIQFRCRVK